MKQTINRPPLASGNIPLIGHALSFAKNRKRLIQRGFKQHGTMFTLRLGRKNLIVLVGPEHHRTFFMQTDKSLNIGKPYAFLKPIVGEVMFVAGPETYNKQRLVFYEPFKRDKMKRYLSSMQMEIQRWLDQLGEEGKIEIGAEMRYLTQQVAARTFMGEDFARSVGDEFWEQYLIISKALDPLLPPHLPLPKFIRRDKARKKMLEILHPIVSKRIAHPDQYDDFLQDLINKSSETGIEGEEFILNLIIGMMFAGHETTAGQAAWTIIQLLQHPQYFENVKTEVENLPWKEPLEQIHLGQINHINWAASESGRMHPSADIMMRLVEKPIEIEGFHIPPGDLLMVSPSISHYDPNVFPNPDQFDPYRFQRHPEKPKMHPYAIIGFGGGRHLCAGMNFALQEISLITALLVQQFELTLAEGTPQNIAEDSRNGPVPTYIHYRRKTKPEHIVQAPAEMLCPHLAEKGVREN
ncbi:MAG: cytochrome P450 [Bacteroidia bacterium]